MNSLTSFKDDRNVLCAVLKNMKHYFMLLEEDSDEDVASVQSAFESNLNKPVCEAYQNLRGAFLSCNHTLLCEGSDLALFKHAIEDSKVMNEDVVVAALRVNSIKHRATIDNPHYE